MKKTIAVILLAAMCFTLCACGRAEKQNDRLQIVCTVFPQYDFVRNIVGEYADVRMLVPLGTESHDFEFENLTVADLRSVASADIVVYVGGESDSEWIERLRKTVKTDSTDWVCLTDMTETVGEMTSESMEHDHDHDHDHDQHEETVTDEHVWTSPRRAVEITEALLKLLCAADESNADVFKDNGYKYIEQLKALDEKMTVAAAKADGRELIFGDRFPFGYLCHDYGLGFDAAFPGCSSETDPSVAQITSLTKTATETGTETVFYMENSNPVFAKAVAKAVGGEAVMLHSCHTLSKAELERGDDYVKLMGENIEKISEAFS